MPVVLSQKTIARKTRAAASRGLVLYGLLLIPVVLFLLIYLPSASMELLRRLRRHPGSAYGDALPPHPRRERLLVLKGHVVISASMHGLLVKIVRSDIEHLVVKGAKIRGFHMDYVVLVL